MAKLSLDEIQKVALLARIELTDAELAVASTEISSILDFVDTIQNTDTTGVEPTSQVTGLTDVWREDLVEKCVIAPKLLLASAPELQDGYIKVKKVL
jgi:aspartyl-tRNA(Asn)/glutamyl-tRNA(Gln) amidotransferase subunit C